MTVHSTAINLSQVNAAKAQAHLIAYDAKFQRAMAVDGPGLDYLKPYTYEPPINPGVHLVRMPIPLSAPELKKFKGTRHFRKNSTAFIDLTCEFYDDGVEEDADKMAAFDWTGFSTSPEAISVILKTWKSRTNAVALNSAESYTDWTGGNFLAATKYANPFKKSTSTTFKNYWTSATLNTTNVQLMIADMVDRRGFNGEPLGFGEKDMVLFASSALWPTALSVAKDERLANGATNPCIKFNLDPECWRHLSAKRWGIIQKGSAMDTHPVFGAVQDSPTTLVLGKDSAKYELTNQMGYNIKSRLGVAFLRYEAISVGVEP
jgi:hypothetical protein